MGKRGCSKTPRRGTQKVEGGGRGLNQQTCKRKKNTEIRTREKKKKKSVAVGFPTKTETKTVKTQKEVPRDKGEGTVPTQIQSLEDPKQYRWRLQRGDTKTLRRKRKTTVKAKVDRA